MTDVDVARVVNHAKRHGRDISPFQAATFLGAREILAREPENANAMAVVSNFSRLLETGIRTISFSEFSLPEECFLTVEEKAAADKSRDEYIRATKQ
jgi:hypothetical protein